MRNSESKFVRRWWVWTAVIASAVILNSAIGRGQDTTPAAPDAAAKAATDAKAPTDQPAGTSDEKPATPSADTTTATPPPAAPPAAETA
ncbi:MAG: hypothetical protein WD176_02435, partial [Pirellulales bacterium]